MLFKFYYFSSEVDLFVDVSELGFDMCYMMIFDGFFVEFNSFLYVKEYWEFMLSDFLVCVDEFVGKMIRFDLSSVYFFIVDIFYIWFVMIVSKYNFVNVLFWMELVLVFFMVYYLDFFSENCYFFCKGMFFFFFLFFNFYCLIVGSLVMVYIYFLDKIIILL